MTRRTKPERKPGVADALVNAWRGGKPGDVPRFVPDDELNTGPRDERGQLKPDEPQTLEARLAKLIARGKLKLAADDQVYTLSRSDRDTIIRALRARKILTEALDVCQMVAKASMSETRPSRGESSIGWQRSDGVRGHEAVMSARAVLDAWIKL